MRKQASRYTLAVLFILLTAIITSACGDGITTPPATYNQPTQEKTDVLTPEPSVTLSPTPEKTADNTPVIPPKVTETPEETADNTPVTPPNVTETPEETITPAPTTTEHAHNWKLTVEKMPTCKEHGNKTYECQDCGEIMGEIIPKLTEHTFGEGVVTKETTCGTEGETTFTCTVCGEIKTEAIPSLNEHVWNEGVITVKPSCSEEGKTEKTCTVCGAKEAFNVPVTDEHIWDGGVITDKGDCVTAGNRMYTCKACGKTYNEEIKPIGAHKYGRVQLTKEPTCALAGERQSTCSFCGHIKYEEIPATGNHDYDDGKVTKEPTCKDYGKTVYTCNTCGSTKEENIAKSTEHSYDGGKITKPATIFSDGNVTYTCKVCKNAYSQSIPKLESDNENAVYTSDKILYVGEAPIHGLMRIGNEYYVPVDTLNYTTFTPESRYFQNDGAYIAFYNIDKLTSFFYWEPEYRITSDQLVGISQPASSYVVWKGKYIYDCVRVIDGYYNMINISALGAVPYGDNFIIEFNQEITYYRRDEIDLMGQYYDELKKDTTEETVKAIHDFLVNYMDYDPTVARPSWLTDELEDEIEKRGEEVYELYNEATNMELYVRYTICGGYTNLFRAFCEKLGIPCQEVTGVAGGDGHAWNRVLVDGVWYMVDCTWDDPLQKVSTYRDTYFMISADDLARSHSWTAPDYPLQEQYDESWNDIDPKNITGRNEFRKCLIAQMMQMKREFVIYVDSYDNYGGTGVIYHYPTDFYSLSVEHDKNIGGYVFKVKYFSDMWDEIYGQG